MKVPIRWLRDLVPTDLSSREIGHRLTMAGLEAEAVEEIGASWENVYVGHVDRVEKHPDADRLKLVTVSAGEHHLTVVTGAPNIAENQKVPLALVGARLIDGYSEEPRMVTLKASSIRGVRSEGMVCSEKELGISDEHEGIMVLDADAPVGAPLREYLGDDVLEFEITPNLVHAFSMIGIARETAAITALPVDYPALAELSDVQRDDSLVQIEAPDLCARCIGTVIENVRIEPSPAWLQRRLLAAGVRPINNIVDVTNYVMLEWGQPLHAYDRSYLNEGRIVVRRAKPNEPLETLDHVSRKLDDETLVIADAERVVGIAGIMGGVDSEIQDDTTAILLEAASFNMANIRRTSRAQKLRTDASARFERGIDPNLAWTASQRAVALIQELIPEARVTAMDDVYPEPRIPRELTMPRSEIKRLLGVDFPDIEVLDILTRLSFKPEMIQDDGASAIKVKVPTWRSDVTIKADLVEEVARIAGYTNLPETLPFGGTVPLEIDPMRRLAQSVQDILVGAGLTEIITYPMLNEDDLRALSPSGDEAPDRYGQFQRPEKPLVRARNPLRTEWEMMRPTMLPALLKNVSENLKFNAAVAVFETAKVYLPEGLDELPDERRVLGCAMAGQNQVTDLYSQARPVDFFDLKGAVAELLKRLGANDVAYCADSHPSLHPGRAARLSVSNRVVGIIGELHPSVAANFGIPQDQPVVVAEIDLGDLYEAGLTPIDYTPVTRFQPVEQDFAVVVDEAVPAAEVEAALITGAGALLSDLRLFDIYRGPAIESGQKSLAYRLTLAARDRALDEREIGRVRGRIEGQIKRRVQGTLRA